MTLSLTPNGQDKHGVLLFAHGSSDPQWAAPIKAVQLEIQKRHPSLPIRIGYLERAVPDFEQAALALVLQGVAHITLLPVFLGVGKHLRSDLPKLISDFEAKHPQVKFRLLPAVGESEDFAPWVASLIRSLP